MRKIFYSCSLLFLSVFGHGQKKFFFDHIDLSFNMHIGEASIQKESWPGLFKVKPTSYAIDSFYNNEAVAKCGLSLPTSFSLGLRFSKLLFENSQHRLVKDRVEWRTGLMVGAGSSSTSFLTSINYNQPPPSGGFTFKEIGLEYRSKWIDINNHIVYKIPSWLFRKNLKYYVGAGAGVTADFSSVINECVTQYRASSGSTGYTITEESNTTGTEKAKNVIRSYYNITWGSEIKLAEPFYILFEGTYQGYIGSFSGENLMNKEAGILSMIFRYKF